MIRGRKADLKAKYPSEMLETILLFPTLLIGIFEVRRRCGIQATDGFFPFF